MATSVNRRLWLSMCLLGFAYGQTAHAQFTPPTAYQVAARQAGVPPTVLYAVALQESSIRLRGERVPWPWTLNIAGASRYYSTRAEACNTPSGAHRPSASMWDWLNSISATNNATIASPANCWIPIATSPWPQRFCANNDALAKIGYPPLAATTALPAEHPPHAIGAVSAPIWNALPLCHPPGALCHEPSIAIQFGPVGITVGPARCGGACPSVDAL
jgi:hypothetical protein